MTNEEFKQYLINKSNLLNKTLKLAHHQSKKTILGTVIKQDKYSITIEVVGMNTPMQLYYGSYHIL